MAKRSPENITLGSGEVFIKEYTAGSGVPEHTDICQPENMLGRIKGGATITYTEETYEEKDDLVSRFAYVEESKTLPFGLVWDMFCEQQGVPGSDWLKTVL